ncbi:MAG: glucose-6-phosphate isomerase [Gorillibacterium sp.]|nr:glucose-6-phosphate isomerase [Gorillibacterium sp.]
MFLPGINIEIMKEPLGFRYGKGVYGPNPEQRTLDSIRRSLRNPDCEGPEVVYSIAMDVAEERHRQELEERMLLFGIVTYAPGKLGDEPIRSQGHIHSISTHSGWSPPEMYEIWQGKAVIYMQETAKDQPGRCFAVYAEPGDVVVVPPNWAHATISANPEEALTFGAWCDRDYGFEYDEVRAHQGLAWYPLVKEDNSLTWMHNDRYNYSALIIKKPADYSDSLGIEHGEPIYKQFEREPGRFQWVSKPQLKQKIWTNFTP